MDTEGKDLYAALMHEMKNNLGLLAMTIDGIPILGQPEHDHAVDEARLLCQRVIDRLLQALLGLPTPDYAHHPLLTDANGARLAKRAGSPSLRSIRESGGSAENTRKMAGFPG